MYLTLFKYCERVENLIEIIVESYEKYDLDREYTSYIII